MRVTQVAPLIAVQDVERSVRFYRQLGFEPVVRHAFYAKLTIGDGGVLHLAAQGEAPRIVPRRPWPRLSQDRPA